MKDFVFQIDGELPAQNEIIEALNSRSRHVYNDMKRRETDRVAWAVINAVPVMAGKKKGKVPEFDRVKVQILFIIPNLRKDPDNIIGSQKFILDGIVKSGILKNDGMKQIAGFSHNFKLSRKNPRIIVRLITTDEEIEEIEN